MHLLRDPLQKVSTLPETGTCLEKNFTNMVYGYCLACFFNNILQALCYIPGTCTSLCQERIPHSAGETHGGERISIQSCSLHMYKLP